MTLDDHDPGHIVVECEYHDQNGHVTTSSMFMSMRTYSQAYNVTAFFQRVIADAIGDWTPEQGKLVVSISRE